MTNSTLTNLKICFQSILTLSIIALSILLCSCAKHKVDSNNISLLKNYKKGVEQIKAKKFKQAVKTFEGIMDDFPYSSWAIKADLISSFAKFKSKQYIDAIVSLDVFIEMHPLYKHMDYVYYLRGRCYEASMRGVDRNIFLAAMARENYILLQHSFHKSIYAKITKGNINELDTYITGNQMHLSKNYYKSLDYISAIISLNKMVKELPRDNIFKPEAHYRLVECYLALGLLEHAKLHALCIKKTFANSSYVKLAQLNIRDFLKEKAKIDKALLKKKAKCNISKINKVMQKTEINKKIKQISKASYNK